MEVTIHYNGQAVAVEVTLEVYEFLDRADPVSYTHLDVYKRQGKSHAGRGNSENGHVLYSDY